MKSGITLFYLVLKIVFKCLAPKIIIFHTLKLGPQYKRNQTFLNKKCQELHGPLMVMSAIPPLNYGSDSSHPLERVWSKIRTEERRRRPLRGRRGSGRAGSSTRSFSMIQWWIPSLPQDESFFWQEIEWMDGMKDRGRPRKAQPTKPNSFHA